jgi:hypothetical protein
MKLPENKGDMSQNNDVNKNYIKKLQLPKTIKRISDIHVKNYMKMTNACFHITVPSLYAKPSHRKEIILLNNKIQKCITHNDETNWC